MTPETQTALREKLSDERINGLLRDGPKARCWFSDIEMVAALRELQQHRALVSPEPAAGEVYDPEFGRHLASMLVPHPTDEPQADDLREPAAGQAQEPSREYSPVPAETSQCACGEPIKWIDGQWLDRDTYSKCHRKPRKGMKHAPATHEVPTP